MATEAESNEHVDIHIIELCGIPVMRKYVKRIAQDGPELHSEAKLRKLLSAAPILVTFFIIISAGLLIGVLYHPSPMIEELTESVFMNFGRGKIFLLEEQLTMANNTIVALQREIKELKVKALANLTREDELRANFSVTRDEKTALLMRLSSVNEYIRLLKEAAGEQQKKTKELEENHEICMKDKSQFQQSLSDAEKRENNVKKELGDCEKNIEHLNDKIKKLEQHVSEADQLSDVLDSEVKECKKDKHSIESEKENVEKELKTTNNALTNCKAENQKYKISNANLQTNLSKCKNELEESAKNLDATKFTLGKCKSKNMDHEVRNLELIEENEKLEKELKACT